MKMKKVLTTVLLSLACVFSAQANAAGDITGTIRVGAYDVEVQNASLTNWVDGDLVITYLNTNATVVKSFTLPKATTGRLLAVGGGGAGGQDQKQGYSASYGLPGGGGAGGLVIKDAQAFDAKTYKVSVGAGGAVVARSLTTISDTKTWVPASYGAGANGGDSTVKQGTTAIVTAKGGGGGGRRAAGGSGGSGGGGSYSSGSKNGGTGTSGQGNAGGKGGHAKFGAGGGGAGGAGKPTTDDTVDGSGAGGAGKPSDITGENLEYARGGAGGVPRLWTHYWDDANGVRHYFTISTDKYGNTTYTYAKKGDKVGSNKYFWCEASDGKPGRDGYGDGGGGSGHYSSNPTFAGRGGNGAVIVRIPPYKTTVEDALKAAFADQPVTVSGGTVTLTGDVTGPIAIPDNLGTVTIKLDGHAITGTDGAEGDDITPGADGRSALTVVPHTYGSEANATTEVSVTGTGSLKGGNGGKGYPGGAGAAAVSADGFAVNVADGIAVTAGMAGESYVQHPHKWAYTVKDNKIIAYCVAEDGEPCSYRDESRGPFVAVSAADAAYTAMRYDELMAVNGITPVTGVVIAPETYVGRDGTDYPESSTPPREQGAYTVNMKLGDLRITSDFTITEPKPSQGSVYQAWKTAERKGRDVQIALSATFDGSKAINDGNVLFLGSRCSAHSMAGGTVESSVNAMTRYASVRWYAYGSSDPANNLVNQWTKKGEKVAAGTVALIGANHFVHKEMMDDLYAELVEKKNRDDGYDLIILEFDGDLLCREGFAPYQLNYRLPEGWTDEKAARLRAAMSRYYAEDRVVWIVPDVNQEKSDAGYTGEYPWTSNPEFIWQRAFLNATETEGYKCPLQKNYEDADELVDYLQEVLVGHFFSNAIIEDTLANGLTIKKVTPQMRSDGGIWRNFGGTAPHYAIPEPRSGKTVKADVDQTGRKVTVTFDMKEEQAWACEHDQVIGDDFRVVIDAELDGFFSVGEGGWQETNEGPATFTFTESNLDEDEEGFTITIEKDSPKIQNVKLTPDYTAEDVVKTYDGHGTNVVVKPISPAPGEAVVRYSLDEHGTYTDTMALTEVCDKTKVWFTITDRNGDFNTVTNYATVTILPRPEPALDPMGLVMEPVEVYFNKEPQNISFTVTNAAGEVIAPDPEKTTVYYKGPGDADWVPADEFAGVSNVTKAAGSTDSNGVVTVEVKVSIEGYEEAISSSTVRVMPRVIAEQTGSATKPYDGTPLTCTNHAPDPQAATNYAYEIYHEVHYPEIYDGPPRDDWADAIGFADGDGLVSVPVTGSQTESGSSPNVVALADVTFTDGANKDDYALSFPEGTLTVTAAEIETVPPSDPAENPGEEPRPGDGPTLWAQNVVKMYDGVGTNVIAGVYNAVSGNGFTIEYSVDETAWVSDLAFTNVVDAQKVYFRATPQGDVPNYLPTNGYAFVTITNRPATITFAAADKVYDGNAVATCTSTNFENVVAGEGFALDTSAMSFAFDTPDVGADKAVTAAGYADSLLIPLGGTLASNYAFTFVETTTAAITHAKQTVTSSPYSDVYDGEGHTITVDPDGGTVTYLVDGAWVPDAPLYTNRVEATNVVFRVTKDNCETFEGTNTVTIAPKAATLESGSRTFPYDGAPHAYTNLAATGFVAGEGLATTSDWATATDVAEGQVDNTFAYGLKPNTLAENYAITVVNGKVAVAAAPVLPKNPAVPAENPGGEPADGDPVTLWAENVVKMYDGVGTNVIAGVYNAVEGNGFTIEYSTDETAWVSDLAFTNVVDAQKVYFRATPQGDVPNYLPTNGYAFVTITNRPVTVTFAAADKVYDGNAVAACTSTNFENVVGGEGFALDTSSMSFAFDSPAAGSGKTVTASGYDDSLLIPLGGTLASNYAFTFVETTLASITAAQQAVTSSPYSGTYDGEGHTIAVDPDGGSVTYWVDGAWVPDAPLYTNRVEATNVVFRVAKDSCETFEGTNTVTIAPKAATLESGSQTFPYDGNPHAFTNLSVTGFVAGEGLATTTDWATVTGVAEGQVDNTFAYALTDNTKAENYVITVTTGKVAVAAAPVLPKNPAVPAENPGGEPADGDPVTLWAENVVKMYDGVGTNVIAGVYNAVEGNGFTIEYSVDDATWVSELAFTNVVDAQKVYFRATPQGDVPNYLPTNGYAFVTITNRPATITFAAADKVYDGNAVATCTATNFENLVGGEGFALDTSSMSFAFDSPAAGAGKTVTASGYDDSLLIPLGGTLASNYAFTFVETTTASITKAALTVTSSDVTECYDGTTHRLSSYAVIDPRTGDPVTPAAISNSADGVTWYLKDDFPLYVDATNAAPVHVAVVAGGYETFESSGPLATVTVTQRVLTVTLNDTNKVYGAATPAWTVQGVDGLVDGDSLGGDPGSVVGGEPSDVSGSPHEVAVGSGTLSAGPNYTVVVKPAKLTIDPAPIEPEAAGVEVEYDGEPHSAEFAFTPAVPPAPDDAVTTNYWTGPLGTPADSSDWTACGTENWAQTDVTNMSVKAEVVCTSGNFLPTNVVADIVIAPRVIADGVTGRSAVRAEDKSMLFGATPPVPTWQGGEGLVEGHFPDVRLAYTNDSNYAAGTYPDAIATNTPVAVTNAAGADVTSNYLVTFVPGTLTVVAKSISPDPVDPTKPADPDMDVEPIDPLVYDGQPKEPEVVVADGVTELIEGVDYTVAYGNNTNATEEAYAVVVGIGNYGGCFTNYFAILPREVTLMSGTKTMYLDPAHPGESVACSNSLVFVVSGSFVTNAATGVKDGFVATDMTVLEDTEPCGPVDNEFTAVVDPGLATNYLFSYVYGQLAILGTPVDAQEEIHEEVPKQDGEGVIDVVMDNREAGKYAADKPPELNELEELVEKGPLDDVEVRLLVSSNYLENSFCAVTNEVVSDARGKGKSEKEIKNYSYEALDIAVHETHWHYVHYDDLEPTSVVTRDIGNEIDAGHMLTITIPYSFNPKLVEFSVWRNHTNDSSGVAHEGVVELPYSENAIAGTETWKTNATAVILRVHKFSVYVFKTLVLTTPQLTGSMQWKYDRAHSVFYGGLDVVCTNGDSRAIRNLSYVYEDRDDCYLRNLSNGARLSDTSFVTYGGKRFGLVRLDDVAAALRTSALNTTNRYGVAETTFTDPAWKDRYVVPTPGERKIALATTSIEKLANGDPNAIGRSLGYLTWQEEGYDIIYWCALGEGLDPLSVNSYDICFLAAGGTGTMVDQVCEYGKVYNLEACMFTPPSGKRFAGWACSNGRCYGNLMLVFNLAKPGGRVTMTALWK